MTALMLWLPACQVNLPATAVATDAITPTPTPLPLQVVVNEEKTYQTIRYVAGGNFIHKFAQVSQALDPIGQLNVATFQPGVVRLRMELEAWEPANDDEDPAMFTWEAFQDTGAIRGAFQALQLFDASGAEIILSAWDVPNWIVINPDNERGRMIAPENRPELVEMIAAFLVHARDAYGVMVDFVSFNEPDIGVNVSLSPKELVEIIRLAGARFEELGLETRWLIGDCSNMKDCMYYLENIWKADDIRPYLGPVAFHSWDSYSPDVSLKAIREFAASHGLEVWCTEAGWDPFLWQNPQAFPGWNNALQLGLVYARVLKLTGASALLYWEMLGKDYPLNDGSQPFPSMQVIEQFHRHFPPGAQIVHTSPGEITLYSVAARTPEGFSVALINLRKQAQVVQVRGVPEGRYTLTQVSQQGVALDGDSYPSQRGEITLELSASSFNFLFVRIEPDE